jgi:hypothetical protein
MASKTKKNKIFNLKNTLYSPLAIDGLTGFEGARGVLSALLGFKDGGRVRGCGVAKRGFGKVMKRKK